MFIYYITLKYSMGILDYWVNLTIKNDAIKNATINLTEY